jgi:RNA-splicing ligase RtcB
VEGTEEFEAYIRGLRWAQQFAALNRQEMMDRVQSAYPPSAGWHPQLLAWGDLFWPAPPSALSLTR